MGLHQDRDEGDFGWPVLSISLGDQALFRMGGTDRRDPTRSIWLSSGDVVVMGGEKRLESEKIPAMFRGLPITLLYIGILALAIYGFTGHMAAF